MKIIALSDLHGHLPTIDPCDVLILAGDIVPINIQRKMVKSVNWLYGDFKHWVEELQCDKVLWVPGNHDFLIDYMMSKDYSDTYMFTDNFKDGKLKILVNDTYKYKGCVFYGCPYSKPIPFQRTSWVYCSDDPDDYVIPNGVDVLITHDNPYKNGLLKNSSLNVKYHFFGHWHEGPDNPIKYRYNCSFLDDVYNIRQTPMVQVDVISQAEERFIIREEHLNDIIHDVESMFVTSTEDDVDKFTFALKLLDSFKKENLLKIEDERKDTLL